MSFEIFENSIFFFILSVNMHAKFLAFWKYIINIVQIISGPCIQNSYASKVHAYKTHMHQSSANFFFVKLPKLQTNITLSFLNGIMHYKARPRSFLCPLNDYHIIIGHTIHTCE
ncbi:hypothetical protein O6H91_03G111500 [Diphasiastrum complanatum]|uniref:Uncharacterized protein n=1 Tax=Diphasiastrum complanatum TaxID=34168 RepID=A0ACC2EAS6_DIPCM|nr:hypothetical protein O6H91_03G111500 [Diphasiastrum complanatum]